MGEGGRGRDGDLWGRLGVGRGILEGVGGGFVTFGGVLVVGGDKTGIFVLLFKRVTGGVKGTMRQSFTWS